MIAIASDGASTNAALWKWGKPLLPIPQNHQPSFKGIG